MVLVVFFQIAIIVLDRYLYISKNFIVIEEVEYDGEEADLLDVERAF